VERKLPEIVAAFHEDVEGAELNLVIVLPGVKRVEVGNPSTPRITASPSSTKRFWRIMRAASTIQR
jgi:hypothetical protein